MYYHLNQLLKPQPSNVKTNHMRSVNQRRQSISQLHAAYLTTHLALARKLFS